jgi:hypothetical protein
VSKKNKSQEIKTPQKFPENQELLNLAQEVHQRVPKNFQKLRKLNILEDDLFGSVIILSLSISPVTQVDPGGEGNQMRRIF